MEDSDAPATLESHLINLSIGSIADHLHQLKDSSRVLGERRGRRRERIRCQDFRKSSVVRWGKEVFNQERRVNTST